MLLQSVTFENQLVHRYSVFVSVHLRPAAPKSARPGRGLDSERVPARLPRRSLSGSPLCHLCWRQAPRRLVPVTGMVQVITRPLRLAKAGLMAPTARPDRRHLTDQTVSKTRRPIRTCLPTRKRRTPWRPDTTSARDPKETDHCCPGAPTLLAVGWEVLPNG